jgi:hypothetical protein
MSPRLLWQQRLASGADIVATLFHDRSLGEATAEISVRAAYAEDQLAIKLADAVRSALDAGVAEAFELGAIKMKMKYRIGAHGWPVGEFLIPPRTVIDTTGDPYRFDRWSREIWNRKLFPPPDAEPLEQSAHEAMCATKAGYFVPSVKT